MQSIKNCPETSEKITLCKEDAAAITPEFLSEKALESQVYMTIEESSTMWLLDIPGEYGTNWSIAKMCRVCS